MKRKGAKGGRRGIEKEGAEQKGSEGVRGLCKEEGERGGERAGGEEGGRRG